MAKKGSEVSGGACTVAEGPNKGKKGTYTVDDEGNVWCEGDWGGTECTNGKCEDAEAQVAIHDQVIDGTTVIDASGFIEVAGEGVFHCSAILDGETGEARKVVAVRIAATPLKALERSSNYVERQFAKAIEAGLRK